MEGTAMDCVRQDRGVISATLVAVACSSGMAAPVQKERAPLWGIDALAAPWPERRELIADYATARYGRPWDFEDGQGSVNLGSGLEDAHVKDGKLIFTTGKHDNVFHWGNHYFTDDWPHDDEKLGSNWPRTCPIMEITVRLKQSLPKATWRSVARQVDSRGSQPLQRLLANRRAQQVWTREVAGTDWQEVDFNPRQYRINEIRMSLGIECLTPGNRVEIDWVKVRRRVEYSYWRGTVELPADVQIFDARGYIIAQPAYEVYVNGRHVKSDRDNALGWRPWTIDLSKLVRPGRNVIAVRRQMLDWMGRQNYLVFMGVVRAKDGRIFEFSTNTKMWKVADRPAEGWQQLDFDDRYWLTPKNLGDVAGGPLPKPDTICHHYTGAKRGRVTGVYNLRPYTGAMTVTNLRGPDRAMVFRVEEGYRIDVTVSGRRDTPLQFVVTSVETGKVALKGNVSPIREEALTRYPVRGEVSRPGVYGLTLTLGRQGGKPDVWSNETMMIAKLDMPEAHSNEWKDGTGLVLVDSANLADLGANRPLFDKGTADELRGPSSEVVEGKAGPYRQTRKQLYDWFATEVSIKNPGRPHVCEVTYPDLPGQTFLVVYREGPDRGSICQARMACGVCVGEEEATSEQMLSLKFFFWPVQDWGTMEVINLSSTERAAVQSIRICEATKPLPAAGLKNAQPGKFYGYLAERLDIYNHTFGQFEATLENRPTNCALRMTWAGLEGLIRHMKFSGLNTLYAPAWMYYRPFFPRENPVMRTRCRAVHPHLLDTMAEMFGANDMHLILGVEWFADELLQDLDSGRMHCTDLEVQRGKETLRAVSHEGKQVRFRYINTGYNYQHPLHEKRFLQMVEDVAQRYAKYKAFKGISFMGGDYVAPCVYRYARAGDDPLKYSYDDVSIGRFEADTGVKIPVAAKDPHRFQKRYEWLMRNAKAKWIDWRCQAVAKLCYRARDILRRARGDLVACFQWGNWGNPLESFVSGRTDLRDSMRLVGVDPDLLKNQANIAQGLMGRSTTGYRTKFAPDVAQALRNIDMDDAFGRHLFAGVTPGSGDIREPRSKVPAFWKGGNYFAHIEPPGRFGLEAYAQIFSHSTPTVMGCGFGECTAYFGEEMTKRELARAFYTLPRGVYVTRTGKGLDKNLAVRQCGSYFYVVNPMRWLVRVSLEFSTSRAEVRDLIGDRVSTGKTMPIALKPFEIRTFKIESSNTRLASASVRAAPEAQAWAEVQVSRMNRLRQLLKERNELLGEPESNALMERVQDVEVAYRDGDYNRVRVLGEDVAFRVVVGRLKEAAEEIPWRVIGPFASPSSAGFDKALEVERDVLAGERARDSYPGLGGSVCWQEVGSKVHRGGRGFVDLNELYGPSVDWALAYALTHVYSPAAFRARFEVGSDDGIKIWLNGKLVHRNQAQRGSAPGQDRVPVRLKKGWNQVLLKIEDQVGGWSFYWTVAADGPAKGLLARVRFAASVAD